MVAERPVEVLFHDSSSGAHVGVQTVDDSSAAAPQDIELVAKVPYLLATAALASSLLRAAVTRELGRGCFPSSHLRAGDSAAALAVLQQQVIATGSQQVCSAFIGMAERLSGQPRV